MLDYSDCDAYEVKLAYNRGNRSHCMGILQPVSNRLLEFCSDLLHVICIKIDRSEENREIHVSDHFGTPNDKYCMVYHELCIGKGTIKPDPSCRWSNDTKT